jgi:hypothetical protein
MKQRFGVRLVDKKFAIPGVELSENGYGFWFESYVITMDMAPLLYLSLRIRMEAGEIDGYSVS